MARFEVLPSPTAFHAAVGDLLLRDECLHSVVIGLVHRLLQAEQGTDWSAGSGEPDRDFLGALYGDDGEVTAAVWRTAPYPLGISGGSEEGLRCLLPTLQKLGIELEGFNGERWVAEAIAAEFSAHDGRDTKVIMDQRLFRLTEVRAPTPVPGTMVDATWDEVDLVRDWAHRFAVECGLADLHSRTPERPAALERGGLRFWIKDGEPVAMAGSMRQSPHGASISWVYTPHAHRGRGYASNLVAALSQYYLDHGKDFCCLFTDQANPTSNKIYQALGYEPVTDFRRIQFE